MFGNLHVLKIVTIFATVFKNHKKIQTMNTKEDLKQAIIRHLSDKVLWAVCEKHQIYDVIRKWVPCTELKIEESLDKLTDKLTFFFGSESTTLTFNYHERPAIGKSCLVNYHLYKIF